jgi:hypothetical protein
MLQLFIIIHVITVQSLFFGIKLCRKLSKSLTCLVLTVMPKPRWKMTTGSEINVGVLTNQPTWVYITRDRDASMARDKFAAGSAEAAAALGFARMQIHWSAPLHVSVRHGLTRARRRKDTPPYLLHP